MGCHTWFYRKTELDTDEKILEKARELRNKMKPSDSNLEKQHLMMVSYAIDNEYIEWLVNTIIGNQFLGAIIRYENGVIYRELDGIYDLFRVSGFPETSLHSYEETKDFIDANTIDGEVHWDDIKNFWNKYPDGIIDFG